MYIIPKIGARPNLSEEITKEINESGKVEIQLFNTDPSVLFNDCLFYLKKFHYLDTIIFHIPFQICGIGFISQSKPHKTMLLDLVHAMRSILANSDTKVGILFHVDSNLDVNIINEYVGFSFMKELIRDTKDSPIFLLFENPIISLNLDDSQPMPFQKFLDKFPSPNVKLTFDLCHWQSSETLLERPLSLRHSDLERLYSIHFSYTPDKKGYINKHKTHARKHPSLIKLMEDLGYLKDKYINLDTVNIVAEICEDDYETQPDVLHELKLLKQANEVLNKNIKYTTDSGRMPLPFRFHLPNRKENLKWC